MRKRKTPEYRIIFVNRPDPEKIMEAFGRVYAQDKGLEFVGVYKVGDAAPSR